MKEWQTIACPRFLDSWWTLAAAMAGIFGFYCATHQDGHDWGGDFSIYVMQARNIAEGRPIGQTGYMYLKEVPLHSAPTFPAGLSLALAPIYKIAGMNFTVLKSWCELMLVLSLAPIYAFARRSVPAPAALGLVVLLGLNVMYVAVKDSVLSEPLYLLMSFLTVVTTLKVYDRGWDVSHWLVAGGGVGILASYTYWTRSIGVSLAAGVLLYDLVKNRRITKFALTVCFVFATAAVMNNLFLHNDVEYAVQFKPGLHTIAANVLDYTRYSTYIWVTGHSKVVRLGMWLVFTPLATYGLWLRISRQEIGPVEYYLMFYVGVLMLYHVGNARYLLPIFPIYLVYALEGAQGALGKRWAWGMAAGRNAVLAGLLIAAVGTLVSWKPRAVNDGITNPDFVALCRYIQAQTAPEALFVSFNPRVTAMLTDRRGATYPLWKPDPLWRFLKDNVHSNYVVVYKPYDPDQKWLLPMLEAHASDVRKVWEQGEFALYRMDGK